MPCSLVVGQWISQWLLVSRGLLQFSRNTQAIHGMCDELSIFTTWNNLLNPSTSISFNPPSPSYHSYIVHSHTFLTTPHLSSVLLQSTLYKATKRICKKFRSYYLNFQLKNFQGFSSFLRSESLIFIQFFFLFVLFDLNWVSSIHQAQSCLKTST